MRRLVALAIALLALASFAGPVAAKGPVGRCPNAHSGFFLVNQQQWWDNTVAGFEQEGIHVYVDGDPAKGFTSDFNQVVVGFGFESAQDFYDYVWVTQWQAIDKNGDLLVCMQDWPETPGLPAYLWGGVDNTAH